MGKKGRTVKKGKKGRKRKKSLHYKSLVYVFFFLLALNLVLGGLNVAKAKGVFIPKQPRPLVVEGVVDLDDLTLQQKIAQMTVNLGVKYYSEALKKMQLGGIYISAMGSKEGSQALIDYFQEGMEIPFMVTVDLEGCFNPFANFKEFKAASKIDSVGAAFEKGKTEGKFLSEVGVTVDFAPVVDLDDEIWNCRSFPGDEEEVSELANAYILGLQDEGILATAKHYPGKTLVIKDPHKYLAAAEIGEEDLYPYRQLIEKDSVKAIMVSHLITYGEVNSEGKPSVVSKRIIEGLREQGFEGLVITDEINMLGLRNFYDSDEEMFVEVFKAKPDIVLNFNNDPNMVYHMIEVVEQAVLEGELSEEKIDEAVRKILEFKGLVVEG